jgi:sec-independent protein translocase protein TatA
MQTLIVGPLGAPELLIILAIVVVLFGATRIGDIGKGIGRGIKEFRQELKDDGSNDEKKDEEKVESTTVASSSSSDEKPTSQTH